MSTEIKLEKPDIESIINELLLYKVCSISSVYWSETLKSQLQKKLSQDHQIDDLVVYRAAQTQDFILCISGYVPDRKLLESEYIERTPFIKILPILIFTIVVFIFTALIARDLHVMMSVGFLVILPLLMGALTEYSYSFHQENPRGSLLLQQFILMIVIILVSVFILREGVICLVMASPFLYLWLCLGALFMRILCRNYWKPSAKVYALSVVPLMVILFDPFSATHLYGTTKNEIIIAAPVSEVFRAINDIQSIKANEIKESPIFWMGFPKPISGMTVKDGDGLTRKIHWQRGIYFEEAITHSEPNTLLAWTYRFTPASFPKGSLDDHVEIGGQYFNLGSTDYRLEAISPTETKLILTIDYRVSTEINWYSKLWVNYVLNEFSDVVLQVYKNRLEN